MADLHEYEEWCDCPECEDGTLLKRMSDEKCSNPDCDHRDVYGRCNDCLAELELVEVIGTGFDATSVFECPVCGYAERAEPSKLVQPP